MKKVNSALSLLTAIGGTAERMAIVASLGWQPNRRVRSKQNAAGSKILRKAQARTIGCRHGTSIPTR